MHTENLYTLISHLFIHCLACLELPSRLAHQQRNHYHILQMMVYESVGDVR